MQMNSLKKISRNPTTFNDILVFSARKFLVKKLLFSLITGPLAGLISLCPCLLLGRRREGDALMTTTESDDSLGVATNSSTDRVRLEFKKIVILHHAMFMRFALYIH